MVGREYETQRLKESLNSNYSELIALYGRRRIGKTFLIRNTLQEYIRFEVTGLYRGDRESQLAVFFKELQKLSKRFENQEAPNNWAEAFELLKTYISGLRGKKKKVIFLDEFP